MMAMPSLISHLDHFTKRAAQEATDYRSYLPVSPTLEHSVTILAAGHSTLSMNTEATPASHSMSHSTQKLRPIAEARNQDYLSFSTNSHFPHTSRIFAVFPDFLGISTTSNTAHGQAPLPLSTRLSSARCTRSQA